MRGGEQASVETGARWVLLRLTAVVDEKIETFRVFERLRLPLIGLIALLGLAAVASPRLMEVFDQAVERTMHHDLAWTGQHARGELHDLLKALIDHAEKPGPATLDEVVLRWDIFDGRMNTWRSGRFGLFLAESPARTAAAEEIVAVLREAEPMLATLDRSERSSELFHRIAALDQLVVKIGGDAYNRHALDKHETNASLKQLQ